MSDNCIELRGMTWDHPRGYDPIVAASAEYAEHQRRNSCGPEVSITWERRPLSAFEETPLDVLAKQYDLMVIDHPHVGDAVEAGCLLPLDGWAGEAALRDIAGGSVGGSYESYTWQGHQWALPIDAAAQVSAWREGARDEPYGGWDEVSDAARGGRMVWPLKPVHALMSFFTLAANRGMPCRLDGETLIQPDDGEAVLEDMNRLASLVPEACFGMDPIDACEAMARGDADQCPMLYGYISYARPGFRPHRLVFGDLPAFAGSVAGSTLGGTGVSVSARTQHPEESVAFAVAVASAEWQRTVVFDGGGQPAHAAAWDDPRLDAAAGGFFRNTRATLDAAWTRPRFPGYIPFQHDAGRTVAAVLHGGLAPAAGVRQLNQRFAAAQATATPS